MNRIRITTVIVLAAAPLALAACSSSGGAPAAKAPAGGSSATSTHAGGPATGSAATGTTGSTGAGGGGGLAAFCKLLGTNSKVFTDIAAGDSKPSGVDVKNLEADLQKEIDAAPSAIKGDVETIVAFDRQLLDHHIEPSETPELTHAMQHYAVWVGKNCAAS